MPGGDRGTFITEHNGIKLSSEVAWSILLSQKQMALHTHNQTVLQGLSPRICSHLYLMCPDSVSESTIVATLYKLHLCEIWHINWLSGDVGKLCKDAKSKHLHQF